MSSYSCSHVKQFKSDRGTHPYRYMTACYVNCVTKVARKRKARDCYCHDCKTKAQRIHACLSCSFFGCYNRRHIHQHAEEVQHNIAIDINFGTVYCFVCKDHMYDPDFELIARKHKEQAGKHEASSNCSWRQHPYNSDYLQHESQKKAADASYLGLRGLVNLGSTCFMNCIVQALIHAPLLREYFLADNHVCHFKENPSMCLVCEMSSLFQEFYSGKSTPHIPYRLLYLVWTHDKSLASSEQQDAHEFFMSILNLLHLQSKGINEFTTKNDHLCNCIIDEIFAGLLQSDVICLECHAKSTTVELFWDIPLDLGTSAPQASSLSSGAASNGAEAVSSVPASLQDCLERYTQPEYLDESTRRTCDTCKSYKASSKQLTLKKLPAVVTFHLKRLMLSPYMPKKITTYVSFPECLDMTPFTSYIHGKSSTSNGEVRLSDHSANDNKYTLFAVVNHVGSFEGGHFISYVRQRRNEWFKCDDHSITKATVEEVLNSEGYLLFYHKQVLEQEQKDDTS